MENDGYTPLLIPAMRPKDFHEVDLSKQQLRVWTDLTGFQPEGREEGRWRRFSPADVFRLSVMREMKGRTGLAITEHPALVQAIGADDFFLRVMKLWTAAQAPCLVTDLAGDHRVMAAAEVDVPALLQASPLHCLLDLAPAIQLMRLAVVRGGTEEQRLLCHHLEVTRETFTGRPVPVPVPVRNAPKPASRRGRGVRAIDPDEAELPATLRQPGGE